MTKTPTIKAPVRADSRAWALGMFGMLAAACAFLLYRNLGLYPTIFADEWYYSKMARLSALSDAIVPSYLYLWLFGATNACGTGFLECTRIGNILFFVGAAPFLYLVAREFVTRPQAFLVTLLALLAPLNVYTAYFMPEATYYFGFCVLSWIALTRRGWHWAAYALALGAVLGLMSLVKVHAIFLVPALALFLLYASWQRGGHWLATGLASAALAALVVFALKFGLGYLFAGKAGLSLLGPFYQGGANGLGLRALLVLARPAFVSARGHLEALDILLGLPLAVLAYQVLTHVFRARGDRLNLLYVYILLVLGAALGVTILFTATLAAPGSPEGLRLHLRYYSFVFPLLWIVAAAATGAPAGPRHPALRWSLALLLLAMLGVAIAKLPTYQLNAVDSPDIYAVKLKELSGLGLVLLEALALLLWAWGSMHAARLYLYAAAPAMVAAGLVTTGAWLLGSSQPNIADTAGEFVRRHVPRADHGRVTVAGTDLGQMMRAQFHIDHKDSSLLQLPEDAPIAEYQLPVRNKWLLVLGKHPLPGNVRVSASGKDYVLVRVNSNYRPLASASFAEPFGTGLVEKAEGLSQPESFGRWSDAAQVVIHFSQPLPRHADIILKAQAYDDNAGLPFTAHVDGSSKTFRLGWTPGDVRLHFDTGGSARTLTIDVPHPVSPAQRGHPGDARKLGIGIAEIEIGDTGETEAAR